MTARRALNVLAKWRNHFAGWQLGTRLDTDPEFLAVRDHRELSILLRVEMTALTGVLLRKGIMTLTEFDAAMEREADLLNKDYEQRWPGITASPIGLNYDVARIQQAGWMKNWRP
jgi:hypothetical protein